MVHFENIAANRKDWKSITASAVGSGGLSDARTGVDQSDGRFGNGRTRRVFDGARDAAAYAGPGCAQQEQGQAQAG
jgi:hypothetical protein